MVKYLSLLAVCVLFGSASPLAAHTKPRFLAHCNDSALGLGQGIVGHRADPQFAISNIVTATALPRRSGPVGVGGLVCSDEGRSALESALCYAKYPCPSRYKAPFPSVLQAGLY